MKIILTGFMGAGKSTVGPVVAEKLGLDFIETDQLVLKRSGCSSIREIFETKGEGVFRAIESEVCKELGDFKNVCIATGGGVVEREENILHLKSGGALNILLAVEFGEVTERLKNSDDRPLFSDPDRAEELFQKRLKQYQSCADFEVDTSGRSIADVIDLIISPFKQGIRKFAVIGSPVEHSLSPRMHVAGYKALSVEDYFVFEKKQVEPDRLTGFVEGLKQGQYQGVSVTIPHKEKVVPYLNELDPEAEAIGTVNTVTVSGGRLTGYNTDVEGILSPLRGKTVIENSMALVLGAGGAARTAVFALKKYGADVTVSNRTREKAESLARQFDCKSVEMDDLDFSVFDIILNMTSVGLDLTCDHSLVPAGAIRPGQVIFDAVYRPGSTRLIREAQQAGAKTIDGLEMLLAQGVRQFEIYTGFKAPVAAMKKALEV
ncbi:MAG: shikimate dehydrogenase [Candidatus Dadabacteria bacterium]|nr:MAG: shikimate dehydrogenase [Candidatus Dadabacteria bacterium]